MPQAIFSYSANPPTRVTSLSSVAFAPDGATMAVGGNNYNSPTYKRIVEIWNIVTGKLVTSYPSEISLVKQVAFSPNGKVLVVGGGEPVGFTSTSSAEREVWSIAKVVRAESRTLTKGSFTVNSLAFSPTGNSLYVGTDNDVEVFSLLSLSQMAVYTGGGANSIAISSRNNLIATSSLFEWIGVSTLPFR